MSAWMIKTDRLCFEYTPAPTDENKNSTRVLNHVGLSIKKGEFVAVLGRNGSGKSTLARHLNALLAPTDGTVWVRGLNTKEAEHTWDIRQSTGMVFQNPDSQLIATVVEEDVAFGPENLGVPSDEIKLHVRRALEAVHMEQYAEADPHYLSGGQKQRVVIAGVLAMRPECIVLDEPTAMLDPAGRREVMETVRQLNDSGVTVILITHFMEEAAAAQRVIILSEGELAMDGPPREVFSRVAEIRALGLEVPPVTALAHRLGEMGISIGLTPLTADEFIQGYTAVCAP